MNEKTEQQLNDDFLSNLENSSPESITEPVKNMSEAEIQRSHMKEELKQMGQEPGKIMETEVDEGITNASMIQPNTSITSVPGTNNESEVVNMATETMDEPVKVIDEESDLSEKDKSETNEEKFVIEDLVKEEKPVVERKPTTTKKTSKKSAEKTIDVISSEEAAVIESKKSNKNKIGKNIDYDDLDSRVFNENFADEFNEIANDSDESYIREDNIDEIIDDINSNYEDSESNSISEIDVKIVDDEESKPSKTEKAKNNNKENSEKKQSAFYGGKDGDDISFKLRTAKLAKILRNINVDNPEELDIQDISSKSAADRQKFYIKTVLPTLQPSIAVVPLIISGTVITMSAWSWPDVKEIVELEEKIMDLDPNAVDYIHEKNSLFIEKRRKQCELFYKHINSVSGFVVKPSIEELFGKIIKLPDFQQLFFAAYAASFNKPYEFDITCGKCGSTTTKSIYSKELCFLLNRNIDIKRLNYFINNGSAIGSDETTRIYNEFQKEKLVEMSNTTYRIKKNLPISSFIYDLRIPTIYEYLNKLEAINEVFRNKDFSYTDPSTYETVYIDSSFGLPKTLIELRKYLYLNALGAAGMISEDKENNSAKVSYSSYKDDSAIINSVYNLSYEDYNALMSDENLSKLIRIDGIRHAIDGGICSEPTCGSDVGKIPIEPEQLFFMTAHQEK